MKFKKVNTLKDCMKDKRVYEIEIDNEKQYNINKYMIYLKTGYRCIDEVRHVDSFDTVKELCEFLNERVIPCNCSDCTSDL